MKTLEDVQSIHMSVEYAPYKYTIVLMFSNHEEKWEAKHCRGWKRVTGCGIKNFPLYYGVESVERGADIIKFNMSDDFDLTFTELTLIHRIDV
jgi:hypothetical protein